LLTTISVNPDSCPIGEGQELSRVSTNASRGIRRGSQQWYTEATSEQGFEQTTRNVLNQGFSYVGTFFAGFGSASLVFWSDMTEYFSNISSRLGMSSADVTSTAPSTDNTPDIIEKSSITPEQTTRTTTAQTPNEHKQDKQQEKWFTKIFKSRSGHSSSTPASTPVNPV
jgi:hypothetical protein